MSAKKNQKQKIFPKRKSRGRRIRYNEARHRIETAFSGRVAADREIVTISFPYEANMPTGSVSSVKSFNPNAAYDVDPSLGSTSSAGFASRSLIYQFYRVISYTVRGTLTSRDTDGLVIYVLNGNLSQGSTVPTNFALMAGQPFCRRGAIGTYQSGNSAMKFRIHVPMERMVGNA